MGEPQTFLDGRVTLLPGDCLESVRALADSSVDSVVTDPPYALVSIVKRFGNEGSAPAKGDGAMGVYKRASSGFMGKRWDTGETAFAVEFWQDILRVLKPGGHVLAFGSTRTYHRLACAIEDSGFEVRDMCAWLYGSGFPKSHNQHGEWEGWGTALKPALEPVVLARKPLIGTVAANVMQHGTGAINIDGCRIHADDAKGGEYIVKRLKPGAMLNATGGNWRPENDGVEFHGEMKPGRWPANVIHDGSAEVLECFPDAPGQQRDIDDAAPSKKTGNIYGKMNRAGEASAARRYAENGSTNFAALPGLRRGDSGSAARFFYTAKADADDRAGSKHPTVKPLDLMQYFVRLITPPGGTVLDPFAGTGTTGEAAWREGFKAILCEREAEYITDIQRRMALAMAGPDERKRESIKARHGTADAGPLFAGAAE